MNIIPIGANCWPALALKEVGLRRESLPFDYIAGPICNVLLVIEKMLEGTFDIDNFCLVKEEFRNDMGFWLGHFFDQSDREFIVEEQELHFDNVNLFKRRFERFQERFFKEKNVLVYTNILFKDTVNNQLDVSVLEKILAFNKNNRCLLINSHLSKISTEEARLKIVNFDATETSPENIPQSTLEQLGICIKESLDF